MPEFWRVNFGNDLSLRLGQWTPDNRGMAFSDSPDPKNIWVQPINGGAPHPPTTFTDKTITDFAQWHSPARTPRTLTLNVSRYTLGA